jgi:DnaJ-class molecular chaperone
MSGNDESNRCPTCFGTGSTPVMRAVVPGAKIMPSPECKDCGGTGEKPKPPPKPVRLGAGRMAIARRKRRGG